MALTGAQLKKALSSVGGGSGMVANADQLAKGANDAMRRVGCKTVTECALFMATLAQDAGFSYPAMFEFGAIMAALCLAVVVIADRRMPANG